MKSIKTTAAILIAASTAITVMAQRSIQIPPAVKASFVKAYPAVKVVKWEKEKGDFEAGFKQGRTQMSATFKADGNQLEAETGISATALPASVIAYIKEHYKSAAIKEAAKITKTATGEVNYEAEVKGRDLLFDGAGKFIKIAKD
ncbi:hypothetical protein FPZ42_16880 [Mucilaginibacter achroorhodeus]|uniref:Putative beta-lactamase-inhibitor-like PepSY-like domain-containing protein n=1 Tax=Mucilaginibacter achroorhodeus TaxID=2599294 RepID=A0A563TZI5_9SPHI|nr:PepSY-like domain-containing protein [Mucilaginibacter achroorhodeus]TWR24162.1 hypothetical protein FPZ42_16880 [Mucilaginibacter achroorhodeus]